MIYFFAEIQDPCSFREAERIEAKNLTAAKKMASHRQAFEGTGLVIGSRVDDQGFIPPDAVLSAKWDGHWTDADAEDED